MYPTPGVTQALMTTISRAPDTSAAKSAQEKEEEVPRPLWLLGGSAGKTIVELVLLNLVRASGVKLCHFRRDGKRGGGRGH